MTGPPGSIQLVQQERGGGYFDRKMFLMLVALICSSNERDAKVKGFMKWMIDEEIYTPELLIRRHGAVAKELRLRKLQYYNLKAEWLLSTSRDLVIKYQSRVPSTYE